MYHCTGGREAAYRDSQSGSILTRDQGNGKVAGHAERIIDTNPGRVAAQPPILGTDPQEAGCTADIRRRKVAESVVAPGLFLLRAGAGTRCKLLDASANVINVTDRLKTVAISSFFS